MKDDREIRPLTLALIEALRADRWPSAACCIDFGLATAAHLGALQYAINYDGVTAEDLDAALGKGAELQKLISPKNPYRYVRFRTDFDNLPDEPKEEGDHLFNSYWKATTPDVPSVEDAARDRDPVLWIRTQAEQGTGAFYVTGYTEDDLLGSCRFSGLVVSHEEKSLKWVVVGEYGNGPELINSQRQGEPLPEGIGFLIDRAFKPEKASKLFEDHRGYTLVGGSKPDPSARRPADLTREELIELVSGIVDILFPADDPEGQWDADTLDEVSRVLAFFDLVPAGCSPDDDE